MRRRGTEGPRDAVGDEQEVRGALAPLILWRPKSEVTVLGIMHLNKKADLKTINRAGARWPLSVLYGQFAIQC
jgi:hypothetical protein